VSSLDEDNEPICVDCSIGGTARGLNGLKELCLRIAAIRHLLTALTPLHAHSLRFSYSKLQRANLAVGEGHARVMDAVSQGSEKAAVKAAERFLDLLVVFTRDAISAEFRDCAATSV
jgi:DNA-binding GntR family transcriptional regulator